MVNVVGPVRVLIPETDPDDLFSAAIRGAGAIPICVGLTETKVADTGALDAALGAFPRADRVAVTTVMAAEIIAAHARQRGTTLAQALGGTPVAAIGEMTVAALVSEGVTPDIVPSSSSSAGLVSQWPPAPYSALEPLAVILGSSHSSSLLPRALGLRGWRSEVHHLYGTATVPPSSRISDAVVPTWPEVVLLTSASTAHALVERLGRPPALVRVCAIGPATAAVARDLGIEVASIAGAPDAASIVSAALVWGE